MKTPASECGEGGHAGVGAKEDEVFYRSVWIIRRCDPCWEKRKDGENNSVI